MNIFLIFRLELIKIYCQAVNCEFQNDSASIRTKISYPLIQLQLSALPIRHESNELFSFIYNNENDTKKYYVTNSMLFVKTDSSKYFLNMYIL